VPGEALERCVQGYLVAGGEQAGSVLAAKLAGVVATLHRAGYVHRDLYASHIFLHQRAGTIELYLIDLARMFAPRWRRFRWRVKDLAQLKFSMPAAWVQRYWNAFMQRYLAGCGGDQVDRYNRRVDGKAASIGRRWARKQARTLGKHRE
jgi:tRNA A-37 threonylcarbamoyl transferase component Bud32